MTNPLFSQQDPACAAIDFRPECTGGAPSSAPTSAPFDGIHVHPVAPPIPGAHFGPLAHLDGFHLPTVSAEGALHAASAAGVLGGSVAAVTAGALAASWLWTWTPIRLRNLFLGSACVLPGSAMLIDGWSAPSADVARALHEISAGALGQGAASAAIATIPAGWAIASYLLAHHQDKRDSRGLASPARTQRSSWARRRREMAAANRKSATSLPLVSGTLNPQAVIGRAASISTTTPASSAVGRLGGRYESLFTVLWLAMREHFVAVGNPGSGKTTMMNRTILSFFATAWRRHQQWWRSDRAGRPLAVVFDIKGALDARRNAEALRERFVQMGGDPARFLSWPHDEGSAWRFFDGSARELTTRFEGMLNAGTNSDSMDAAEAYYLQMRKAVLHLVIDAPNPVEGKEAGEDPPRGFFEYLDRMSQTELVRRWAGYPDEQAAITAITSNPKNPVLDSERTAMMNLARELGEEFEGEARITDYDVVYCCLEGITSPLLAQAQFGALVAMLTQLAGTDHGRCIQLFVDEFAQVCGDAGAARIVELLRSAGIGSGWFAQSWMGLGANEDQRHRLVDSCSGGIFAMRSNSAGQLAEKIGTRPRIAISRKIVGTRHGDEGNVQPEDVFLVSPAVMADFAPGDIVHVRAGRAAFGHISPLKEALRPLPGLAASTPSPVTDPAAGASKGMK